MVSTPRVSTGPAGYRINRDYARRGWAAKTPAGHPSWGIKYHSCTTRRSMCSGHAPVYCEEWRNGCVDAECLSCGNVRHAGNA